MMLHFLEQAGQHQAKLKKKDDELALLRTKDDEIAKLKAEMKKLKAQHQSELEKAGQDYTEERERLSLQLSKERELLQDADVKLESANTELVQLRKRRDDCTRELTRIHNHILRKFLYLIRHISPGYFPCIFFTCFSYLVFRQISRGHCHCERRCC